MIMVLLNFLKILDERQLQDIVKLAEENLKMPVWKYNDKWYREIHDQTLLITELIYLMKLPKVNWIM